VNRKVPTVRRALKEAGSETCGATNRNRIEGGTDQGEWAMSHEALAIKERFRKSGARAGTVSESYLGRSRLALERVTVPHRSEKSAEAVVAAGFGDGGPPQCEGPNKEKSESSVDRGNAMHQTSEQLELLPRGWGEAPTATQSGEAGRAAHGAERSGNNALLMQQVVARENAIGAFKRVRRNKGSPGMDGMTVEQLEPYLREHWPTIREQLVAGTYQPSAVRRHEIPKSGGGMRQLGIPTVLDRFVQQLVLQVLQPIFDPTFSEHSHGFRPGRRAHDAVREAQRYLQAGRPWVVDGDLEKFFDRVNHDVLMGKLQNRIKDPIMLRLIRRYLAAGLLADGVVMERHEGTPQGGPLTAVGECAFGRR
jgi:RNA-directed DNA polymerase